jgi:uncharacterized protein YoxC
VIACIFYLVTVNATREKTTIMTIIDPLGKILYNLETLLDDIEVNVADLQPGVYYVSASSGSIKQIKKFVKR